MVNLAYYFFFKFNEIQIKSCQKLKETLNEKCRTQDIMKNCFMASLKRKT